jgi:hypothetical protein
MNTKVNELNERELRELITLEYVLVQGYSEEIENDTKRLDELRKKREKLKNNNL